MSYHQNVRASSARPKTWKEKAVQSLIYRSWWMFLFIFLCFFVYSHGSSKKKLACFELEQRLAGLRERKALLVQEQEDLMLQINSQSDPAWIQLMLMKGLGVVPEGQAKVYFQRDID